MNSLCNNSNFVGTPTHKTNNADTHKTKDADTHKTKDAIDAALNGLADALSGTRKAKCMSEKDFIKYLEENRHVNCHTVGVDIYIALLKYDLSTGKSGFDKSTMPKFSKNLTPKVIKYIKETAKTNTSNKRR